MKSWYENSAIPTLEPIIATFNQSNPHGLMLALHGYVGNGPNSFLGFRQELVGYKPYLHKKGDNQHLSQRFTDLGGLPEAVAVRPLIDSEISAFGNILTTLLTTPLPEKKKLYIGSRTKENRDPVEKQFIVYVSALLAPVFSAWKN